MPLQASLIESIPPEPATELRFRIGRMPGNIRDLTLPAGSTVNDALNLAEIEVGTAEIRVDGQQAKPESPLRDTCTILVVQKIQGNSP